jgi:uncharacterized protein (TIGR02246 family)
MAALTSTTKASSMPARMTVRPVSGLLALAAALAAIACTSPKLSTDNGMDRHGAAAIVERYQSATNQEDAEQLASMYAQDALLLPPDGGVVQGQDEIRRFWAEGLERGLVMDTLRVALAENLGWVVGRYYLAGSEEAPPDSGKFVLALARTDGRWLVAADIWNATPSEMEDGESGDPRTRILSARQVAAVTPASLPAWRRVPDATRSTGARGPATRPVRGGRPGRR